MGTEANDFLRGACAVADRLPLGIDASKQTDRLKKLKAESLAEASSCLRSESAPRLWAAIA
jgi:hypothetical protein